MTDLRRAPHVITAGIELLATAVERQAAVVSRVEWRPPMAGTSADLAAVMADPRRREANSDALRRVAAVRPQLVDVAPAGEVLRQIGRAHV